MPDHQVGRLLDEGSEVRQARGRVEVKVGAHVQAAVAEVAVEGSIEAELRRQLGQLAQVGAESFGRNGRILPARRLRAQPRDDRGGTHGRLTQAPQRRLSGRIRDDARRPRPQVPGGPAGLSRRLAGILTAVLDQQPAAASRQLVDRGQVEALEPAGVDQSIVEPLEPDGTGREYLRRPVSCLEDVGEPEDQQGSSRRALDQPDRRLEDRDARSFGADQRPRDIEAVLRKKRLQRKARDEPRQLRKSIANRRPVAVPQGAEGAVDVAPPARLRADARQLVVRGPADRQAEAVVSEHLERLDVVARPPGHDRVGPARIVAEHAAQRAAVVSGRVRAEGQAVAPGRAAEIVQDDARLDARQATNGVHFEDPVEVA